MVSCQSDPRTAATPTPSTTRPAPTLSASVGALFVPHAFPALHTCTASVVHSPTRDVIMTAAHCLTGDGVGYRFAPGYRHGQTPYGVWDVTAAYGAPGWLARRDPHRDWAFLTVATQRLDGRSQRLEDLTGAHALGATAARGSRVTVIGYALGSDDSPVRCTTPTYRHHGYPAFDCDGFPAGTSGSPWLGRSAGGVVVRGVIGGLRQGGCTAATSYTPLLGAAARRALTRAAAGTSPDSFPSRGSDGC